MSLHVVGVVVIGRNEGERLERCLLSALRASPWVVYVDSASTDDSIRLAEELKVNVVPLGRGVACTAGLARNAGFECLARMAPDVEAVQFIDGDCELEPSFIPAALEHLQLHPSAAIVCGRRRERYPEASVYNRLCDIEWDTPVGRTAECGGDFLVRAPAFAAVGGFASELIAGEEPDLCARLRAQGWEIFRLDEEMTVHDAAITRFFQWWRRNVRSGHAYAEALSRRGGSPDSLRPVMSNAAWAAPPAWLLWPLLFFRVYRRRPDTAYAAFLVLGKLPQAQGQLKYWFDRVRGQAQRIIEYR